MFSDVMLLLIFLVLLWIAVGLQVIASSIRILGRLIRPSTRKLRHLERTTMPFLFKIAAVKIFTIVVVRYISRKFR